MRALLTVTEVARALHCSEGTVYRLVERKLIDCIRVGVGRGHLRFSEEAVADYEKRRTVKAGAGGAATRHPAPTPKLKHLRLD
jgi:excisionase family DNA binding protein